MFKIQEISHHWAPHAFLPLVYVHLIFMGIATKRQFNLMWTNTYLLLSEQYYLLEREVKLSRAPRAPCRRPNGPTATYTWQLLRDLNYYIAYKTYNVHTTFDTYIHMYTHYTPYINIRFTVYIQTLHAYIHR